MTTIETKLRMMNLPRYAPGQFITIRQVELTCRIAVAAAAAAGVLLKSLRRNDNADAAAV